MIASKRIPDGPCVVKAKIDPNGSHTVVTLFIDDQQVGSTELSVAVKLAGKSNAVQVGRQWGVPVNGDYESPFYFSGRIFKACIDIDQK